MPPKKVYIKGVPCKLEPTEDDGQFNWTKHVGGTFYDNDNKLQAFWIPKAIFETFPDWREVDNAGRDMYYAMQEIINENTQ
jgi:hypothetical protein